MHDYSFIIDSKKLYSEKTLVYFDLPLMFICHDSEDNKYLALCTDSEELTYIVVQTSVDKIIMMLENELTMDSVFVDSEKKWRIKAGESQDIVTSVSSFEESELPEKGAYFSLIEESNKEYLNQLRIRQKTLIQYKVSDFNIYNIKKQLYKTYISTSFYHDYNDYNFVETTKTKSFSSFFILFKNPGNDLIDNQGFASSLKSVGGNKYGYKFAF